MLPAKQRPELMPTRGTQAAQFAELGEGIGIHGDAAAAASGDVDGGGTGTRRGVAGLPQSGLHGDVPGLGPLAAADAGPAAAALGEQYQG